MEVLCASRIRKSQLSWECGRWCPVVGVYRHQKKECPGISSIHHTQGKQRMVHQRENSHVSLPGSSHRLHEHLLATHVVTRPTAHLFAFCLSTKPVRSKMFRWLGDPEFKGSSYLRCLTACHTRASSATSTGDRFFVRAKVPVLDGTETADSCYIPASLLFGRAPGPPAQLRCPD